MRKLKASTLPKGVIAPFGNKVLMLCSPLPQQVEPEIESVPSSRTFTKLISHFFGRSKEQVDVTSRYVDLAPTSNADPKGIYSTALAFATTNDNVYNIALTGPYGSGKSSIINTFLKRYKGNYLRISLASFLPDSEGKQLAIDPQEIERSILQQMLYGQDADKLPLSRFKRIQRPSKYVPLMSLLVLLGCFSAWHLFQSRSDIVSGEFFTPFELGNWLNYATFGIGFAFLWRLLHQLYVKSLGISVKSISLRDVEMSTDALDKESILNRHLDEIIYFFQSTSYELVIIEDLDRFDRPEIFVTLREINGLINANNGVNQRVRFLYALRDDMFANKDRTKFFEFIVPVIPIINSSNSIDKVLEEGQRLQLEKRLNPRFLREVSRYLDDLRLIKNIFNEYATYIDNLEQDEQGDLDPSKLLAILIYKNIMPDDFELLHQQKGKIATILQRYDECVAVVEADKQAAIQKINEGAAEAEAQHPRNLKELRRIYAMAIADRLNDQCSGVRIRNVSVHVSQLTDHKLFEEILSSENIQQYGPQAGVRSLNLSGVQSDVDTKLSYAERKELIERRSSESKAEAAKKVQDLRDQIVSLRRLRFSDVLQANAATLDGDLAELGENRNLMEYLLFEGFLDDTYYQYISLFHSGRLSPADNNFLKKIRGFKNPDPDFQIDNPAEVIVEMRDEDFQRSYVLNRHLMDHMLENPAKHKARIDHAMKYIADNFANAQDFLESYYTSGKRVHEFVETLSGGWAGFAEAAVETRNAPNHVAVIMKSLPVSSFTAKSGQNSALRDYLSDHLVDVLNTGIDFELGRLKTLGIVVLSLAEIAEHASASKYVVENSLYRVTYDNIHRVMQANVQVQALKALQTQNFSTILSYAPEYLRQHIRGNFQTYLDDVLLPLEDNTEENLDAIRAALNYSDVTDESLTAFITKQDAVFENLDDVPERFFSSLFEHNLVKPKWSNVIHYMGVEEFNGEVLTAFLRDNDNSKPLLAEKYLHNDETIAVSRFILKNEDLSDAELKEYLAILPTSFKDFPDDANLGRRQILAASGVIALNTNSFSTAAEDDKIIAALLVRRITDYLKDKVNFAVEERILKLLLSANLTDAQKLSIILDLSSSSVAADAELAALAGPILDRSDVVLTDFDFSYLSAIVRNTRPIDRQISLLNRCHEKMSEDQVRQVLSELPSPYSTIAEYWVYPRIKNTEQNRILADWLQNRGIISSWSITFLGEIRVNTFRRPREGA
ncbi:ATP-binding protein [Maritimibacter fusiformis]|uniref:ATP-binding protein n=1 Tax=Maritimibacter fusiformis TaxID=2603819 RepID=A0A5D0RNE3_9RHOB|nr:ATP-binding protein [Maritimibacter fusiformis]TYB83107.1 ATP-binding protein [Maritimibacter fusiformis]